MPWCDNGKNHFNVVFYGSNGYMRPTWIHENERNDTVKIKHLLEMEIKKTIDSWAKGGRAGSLVRKDKQMWMEQQ